MSHLFQFQQQLTAECLTGVTGARVAWPAAVEFSHDRESAILLHLQMVVGTVSVQLFKINTALLKTVVRLFCRLVNRTYLALHCVCNPSLSSLFFLCMISNGTEWLECVFQCVSVMIGFLYVIWLLTFVEIIQNRMNCLQSIVVAFASQHYSASDLYFMIDIELRLFVAFLRPNKCWSNAIPTRCRMV